MLLQLRYPTEVVPLVVPLQFCPLVNAWFSIVNAELQLLNRECSPCPCELIGQRMGCLCVAHGKLSLLPQTFPVGCAIWQASPDQWLSVPGDPTAFRLRKTRAFSSWHWVTPTQGCIPRHGAVGAQGRTWPCSHPFAFCRRCPFWTPWEAPFCTLQPAADLGALHGSGPAGTAPLVLRAVGSAPSHPSPFPTFLHSQLSSFVVEIPIPSCVHRLAAAQ